MFRKLSFILVLLLAVSGWARELQVKSGVEATQVRLGESLLFQVLVDADQPAPPDLAPLQKDFTVQAQGEREINRTSAQFVNGRYSQIRERGTLYSYQLFPKRAGRLTVPALKVTADGAVATTLPVELAVSAADQSQQCRLACILPGRQVYVGEQVEAKFQLRLPAGMQQVRGLAFSLPAKDAFGEWRAVSDPQSTTRIGVVGMSEPVGVKVENEAGEEGDYILVTLRAVWLPLQAGQVAAGGAAVQFQVPDERASRRRANDPFADMEEMLGGGNRWRTMSAVAEERACEVREPPAAGRPAGFSGLVARQVVARLEASPVEAKVGDPIQLKLTLENSNPFPTLGAPKPDWRRLLPAEAHFKVPADAEDGMAIPGGVTFAQSVRATSAEAKEVPALAIPYFDPVAGKYAVAKTEAVPLKIEASRMVTAADGEGAGPVTASRGVESTRNGVAANVSGSAVLEDQSLGWNCWRSHPGWLAGLFLPPLAWLAAAVFGAWWRRQRRDPVRLRSRRAAAVLESALQEAATPEAAAAAFQGYLGDKLNMPPGAITLADVQRRLPASAEAGARERLAKLFAAFDLCRYGGGRGAALEELRREVGEVARGLEKLLLFLVLFAGLSGLAALDEPARRQTLVQAEAAFAQGMASLDTAPEQARQEFQVAYRRYRTLEEDGVRNGWLYYNLGNACYRLGDIGRAILYYRRAEFFIPDDPQLRDNLLAAQARRADAVEDKEGEGFWRPLFFWHYWLSRQQRTSLFLALVLAASLLGIVRAAFPRLPRWPVLAAAAAALLLCGSLAWEARERQATRRGVVVAEEVVARKGDAARYEPSFAAPLHAGTEFTVLQQSNGWSQVRLLDGRVCWLPDDAVGRIAME